MSGVLKKGIECALDSQKRFLLLATRGCYNKMDDESYLKRMFRAKLGYSLDLNHPKTFNEKLQWLKLHDRNPLYTTMVDKYAVRRHIADTIGEKYLIPLLGRWDSPDDIDFDALPNQFVLKCNHDSGGLVICKDKSKLDVQKAKAKLGKSLKRNFYYVAREWPYKNVKPCIVAEEYLEEPGAGELKDYKAYVFSGKSKYFEVHFGRFGEHHKNCYDTEWGFLPFSSNYPADPGIAIPKPQCLREMLELAEKLASSIGLPAVLRVDFYVVNNRIFFGELTFYPSAGFAQFMPEQYDRIVGEWIDLKEGEV